MAIDLKALFSSFGSLEMTLQRTLEQVAFHKLSEKHLVVARTICFLPLEFYLFASLGQVCENRVQKLNEPEEHPEGVEIHGAFGEGK